MLSRRAANAQVAEVARRRLELVSAELAGINRSVPAAGSEVDGSGTRAPEERPGATHEGREEGHSPAKSGSRTPGLVADGGATAGKHAHRPIGLPGRVGGWVHDRLPPTLQGSVGLTSAHLTVVSLLVAAALAVAAWWVLRADAPGTVVPSVAAPSPLPTASPLVATADSPPASSVSAPSTLAQSPGALSTRPSAGTAKIIVDVAGRVRRPGIATLPAGSRVADALRSAGGARRGVNLTALNLARVLVDGEQILVGIRSPTGVAAPAASAPVAAPSGMPAQLVNLNTADQVELETLPGVGPVTAQAILTWRTEHGAFTAVEELLEISGIGDATLAEMAPFVTI